MALHLLANNASGTVENNPLSDSGTNLVVDAGLDTVLNAIGEFPYFLTIWDDGTQPGDASNNMEIVEVTARPSAENYTIGRGEQGTSGVAHAQGSNVALLWTKENAEELLDTDLSRPITAAWANGGGSQSVLVDDDGVLSGQSTLAVANAIRTMNAADILQHDTFTDSNGTEIESHTPDIGTAWEVMTDPTEWTIEGNELSRTENVIDHCFTDTGETDVALTVTFVDQPNWSSILIRRSDGGNYWEFFYDNVDFGWQLNKVVGSVDIQIGAVIPDSATGTVTLMAKGNTITAISPNGTIVTTEDDDLNTNTEVGFILNGTGAVPAALDNLLVTRTTASAGGGGVSIGDTVTSGTEGSVLFLGASNVLAQDNSALFFNQTDNRLGINTTAPVSDLHINNTAGGTLTLGLDDTTISLSQSIGKIDFWSNDSTFTTQGVAARIEAISGSTGAADAAQGRLLFYTTGNTVGGSPVERMRIDNIGRLGLGTSFPTSFVHATAPQPDAGTGTTGTAGYGITLTASTGGNTTNAGTNVFGGTGGAFALTAGAGGTVAGGPTNGFGGTGGGFTLAAGTGGAGNGTNPTGGNGGDFVFTAGTGGFGTTAAGRGGHLSLNGGSGGSGANSNGGNVYLIGGAKNSSGTDGHILLGINSSSTIRGNVGIGTSAPDKKLEINLGTSDALRLTYNDSNGSAATYMDTTLASDGGTTFTGAGSAPDFTFSHDVLVPDEAYGGGWDGSLEVPTKNAVYDKIETLGGGSDVSCRAYRTTDVSLTANVWATIDLDNESYDTSTFHDNSTNPSRLTIPSDGKYLFTASAEFTANKTKGLRLKLNGSVIEGAKIATGNSGFDEGVTLVYENSFTAGDYVEIEVVTANTSVSCTFGSLTARKVA